MNFELRRNLLHQQHLAGSLDGAIELALIMGRQTGVFAGQDSALVGDELPEQIHIFVVQGIDGEIDLGFGARRALFHRGRFAATSFGIALFCVGFARHKALFDFAVDGVAAQRWIVFFDLQLFGLGLLIARRRIARRGLAFLARLRALDGNDFSRHV